MKKHFDESTYNTNVQALNGLCDSARKLADAWYQICKTPLDADIYHAWLQDFELVYLTYEAENRQQTGEIVWNALPDTARRPKFNTHGMILENIHRNASMHNFYGTIYQASTDVTTHDIDWTGGRPEVSESTLKRLQDRYTFTPSKTDEQALNALQRYVDAHNEYTSLTSANKLPVQSIDGTLQIDYNRYFRTKTA